MSISLKNLLWFSALIVALHSSAQETPIHVTFNYHDSLSVERRASAFAQWWNHMPTSTQEEARVSMMEWNIQPAMMLSVLGFENTPEGWELMRKNIYYYEEQGVKFKEAFYRLVNDASQKVKIKIEQLESSPSDAPMFIFYQPEKQRFIIEYVNGTTTKVKISGVSAQQKIRVAQEVFWKTNGKKKKHTILPGERAVQVFEIEGNERVKIALKKSKEVFSATLHNKRMESPLIRDFFVSDVKVFENQRVYLTWEVLGAKQVTVSNGIGTLQPKWQVATALEESTGYTLSAENENGKVTDSLFVEVERVFLKEAKLTFFTPDLGDPKEKGSLVKVALNSYEKGDVVFYEGLADLTIKGKDLPYVGPFDMQFEGSVFKRYFIRGEFRVALEGSKADTWTFSPILILHYSDGSKRELFGYGNKEVSTGGEPVIFKF